MSLINEISNYINDIINNIGVNLSNNKDVALEENNKNVSGKGNNDAVKEDDHHVSRQDHNDVLGEDDSNNTLKDNNDDVSEDHNDVLGGDDSTNTLKDNNDDVSEDDHHVSGQDHSDVLNKEDNDNFLKDNIDDVSGQDHSDVLDKKDSDNTLKDNSDDVLEDDHSDVLDKEDNDNSLKDNIDDVSEDDHHVLEDDHSDVLGEKDNNSSGEDKDDISEQDNDDSEMDNNNVPEQHNNYTVKQDDNSAPQDDSEIDDDSEVDNTSKNNFVAVDQYTASSEDKLMINTAIDDLEMAKNTTMTINQPIIRTFDIVKQSCHTDITPEILLKLRSYALNSMYIEYESISTSISTSISAPTIINYYKMCNFIITRCDIDADQHVDINYFLDTFCTTSQIHSLRIEDLKMIIFGIFGDSGNIITMDDHQIHGINIIPPFEYILQTPKRPIFQIRPKINTDAEISMMNDRFRNRTFRKEPYNDGEIHILSNKNYDKYLSYIDGQDKVITVIYNPTPLRIYVGSRINIINSIEKIDVLNLPIAQSSGKIYGTPMNYVTFGQHAFGEFMGEHTIKILDDVFSIGSETFYKLNTLSSTEICQLYECNPLMFAIEKFKIDCGLKPRFLNGICINNSNYIISYIKSSQKKSIYDIGYNTTFDNYNTNKIDNLDIKQYVMDRIAEYLVFSDLFCIKNYNIRVFDSGDRMSIYVRSNNWEIGKNDIDMLFKHVGTQLHFRIAKNLIKKFLNSDTSTPVTMTIKSSRHRAKQPSRSSVAKFRNKKLIADDNGFKGDMHTPDKIKIIMITTMKKYQVPIDDDMDNYIKQVQEKMMSFI